MSNIPTIGVGNKEGKRVCGICDELCKDGEDKIEYLSSNKYNNYWRFIHLDCFLMIDNSILTIEKAIKKLKKEIKKGEWVETKDNMFRREVQGNME